MMDDPGETVRITDQDGQDITEVVRLTYDMATNSMDYGSGLLSTEEMETLVALARILHTSDCLDVVARLNRMKFPQGVNANPHTYVPDRPGSDAVRWSAGGALCKVCGEPGSGWPFNHEAGNG